MLPHKHTKEGVLNEKLALKKLLTYMKSVYKIPQKIKGLSDERKRKSIPLFNIVMPVLIFLMLQYESFHTIFSAPESMEKRLKNCIRGKIPKVDAVRDLLSRIDPKEIEEIHAQTIDVLKRNRVFREGTIGGYVAAGIDGMELFSSTKKSCPDCLSRKNGTGKTKYFRGDELWRSSIMQPAKASQKSSQSFRTKSNSSTATEPSSASAIPTAWHFPPITTNVRSARCLTKQINICMKTSRDARTKETPEPEISYRRFWRFFLLFLFYFFANASICAYPAEKSMGSSRSFFLTASRPS